MIIKAIYISLELIQPQVTKDAQAITMTHLATLTQTGISNFWSSSRLAPEYFVFGLTNLALCFESMERNFNRLAVRVGLMVN